MILETIFIWVGGITLICFVLYFLLKLVDKIFSGYAKSLGVFWRVIYVSLFIKDVNRWLNKRISESNGKNYKIIEIKKEQKLKNEQEEK